MPIALALNSALQHCHRRAVQQQHVSRTVTQQPGSSAARLRVTSAVAETVGSNDNCRRHSSELSQLDKQLAWQLRAIGGHDGVEPDQHHVRKLSSVVQFLEHNGIQTSTAVWLALEHEHLVAGCDIPTNLGPKLELFKRLCTAEHDWGDVLVAALRSSPGGAALELPTPAFEAAMQFVVVQLQHVSRQRYEQLHQPYSLYRFVQLHPDLAGGLLAQHPAAFQSVKVPWLRQQLGWGDTALADAALSPWLPQLCRLDVQQAKRCVDWLLRMGLSREEAGQLLLADVRLLVGPERQLEGMQEQVQELAAAWRVGNRLVLTLVLTQPWLSGGMADRTRELVQMLQATVGMSEEQVFLFALEGGLDGGSLTRTEVGAQRATDRLKQLLMVYGGWPGVVDALARHPEALSMPWQGVGSLLGGAQQQLAWRMVVAMQAVE